MEPFSPDLIAQIATKLFREGPSTSSPLGEHLTPSHLPSTESIRSRLPTTPDPSSTPASFPSPSVPSPSIPLSVPYATPFDPNSFTPSLSAKIPAVQNRIPTSPAHQPSIASSSLPSSVPSGETGLQQFVSTVRRQTPVRRHDCLDPTRNSPPVYAIPRSGSSDASPIVANPTFDVLSVRNDFPILNQRINGHPLAWMDNAATTQKPQVVIDAISRFYEHDSSNIHRAAHTLAARATDAYEASRKTVASFLGARSESSIVFTRGTTEAINLVANTYGQRFLKKGDEILLSTLEHHANIVPWQMIAKKKGAEIRVIPVNDHGEVIIDEYLRLLNPRTKIVALTHASNSLGTILPVHEMTHMAKRYGSRVLIDGAQSVSHIPINVQMMDCDFFVFSGHKIFGPTGIGAVYIKEELHDILPPWQGGGNMIKNVTFEKTTYAEAPGKFEAGTPNIADAVGLKVALDYVSQIGLQNIAAHEHDLMHHATQQLESINGVRIIGTAREKVSVISFVMDNHTTEEIGKALDQAGIAVRSGHHCAQPSLRRFGLETTVRPSFSLYNTHQEVDRLIEVVRRLA